jgi:hypothetical protein
VKSGNPWPATFVRAGDNSEFKGEYQRIGRSPGNKKPAAISGAGHSNPTWQN